MKLPSSGPKALSEVFVMRISKEHKQKLEQLAKKNNKYGKNSSDVVRALIDKAHSKRI
jgi:predicted DNA-binding protein